MCQAQSSGTNSFQASEVSTQTCLCLSVLLPFYCPFPSHCYDMVKAHLEHICSLLSPPGRAQNLTGTASRGMVSNVRVSCITSALCSAQDNLLHRAFPGEVVHQVLFLKNLGQVIPAVALMTSMSYSRGEIGPLFFMSICPMPIKEKKTGKEDQGRKVIESKDYLVQRLTSRCGMFLFCSCCTL